MSDYNGKSVAEVRNILRARYPNATIVSFPETTPMGPDDPNTITILYTQLDPLQNPEVAPNYLQIVTNVIIPESLGGGGDLYTAAPAPSGIGDSELEKYCVPLQTGEIQPNCTTDYKGYGYDASRKECILIRCDHTFGARFQTKADCEATCKEQIEAPPPQQGYTNPSPPPMYLWTPNVCIFLSAEAWMKNPGGTIRVLSLPANGQPELAAYNPSSYDALFRISKDGIIKSLSGRTLRFMDSEHPHWEFKQYMLRNLGQLAFNIEQKKRFLATHNTTMVVTATNSDNTDIKAVWFVIPIGQM